LPVKFLGRVSKNLPKSCRNYDKLPFPGGQNSRFWKNEFRPPGRPGRRERSRRNYYKYGLSVPAIFPVPFNTDFTICHDVPLVISLVNKEERTVMIQLIAEAGARGSSFLVNDPRCSTFLWKPFASTFPDSFVPVKTCTNLVHSRLSNSRMLQELLLTS